MHRILLFLIASLLLASCGMLPELPQAVVDTGPTPTPLPTSSAEGYPTVADRACLLAKLEPLRVEQLQGDLLAWRPDLDELAFVGPASSSNWFTGRLMLAAGPEYNASTPIGGETVVYGDLSWSPDGSILAFVALRVSDGVYTIMTITADDANPIDWLPGESARTGDLISSKAIIAWQAGQRLRFLSACGPDCDQEYQLNLTDGSVTAIGEQIRRSKERLALRSHQVTYDEATYPYMLQPNWSHDNSKIAYIDEDDRAMVLLVDEQIQYIMDIGINTPRETKWSYDNRKLAVRTDDWIFIFDSMCKSDELP